MIGLIAQLFVFHAAWGPPAYRAPPPPPPAIISADHAGYDALCYCRDSGMRCRVDGARLVRPGLWRVFLDVKGHHHRRGEMMVDVDAWSGRVLAAYDRPHQDWRWSRW
jgi:hypothetical protein